jgi:hypothetical protein
VLANTLERDFLVPGNPLQMATVLMHWLEPERRPSISFGSNVLPIYMFILQ